MLVVLSDDQEFECTGVGAGRYDGCRLQCFQYYISFRYIFIPSHPSTGTKVMIIVGFYFKIWWLDALGGLLLSLYVIIGWSKTSSEHIRNLSGCAASADERSVLLYLTMRFAKTIKQIQGLQAYHVGDSLNVEVDVVLDESISLRDSHDLGESLQYVLESVPTVDRAFVHLDYASWNLPSHMQQN